MMEKPTADDYVNAFRVPYEKLIRSLADSESVHITIDHAEMRNTDAWTITVDIMKGDKGNA